MPAPSKGANAPGTDGTDEVLQIARDAARRAEEDAGLLRGELADVRVQLARARQELEWALAGRSVWPRRLIRSVRRRVRSAVRR